MGRAGLQRELGDSAIHRCDNAEVHIRPRALLICDRHSHGGSGRSVPLGVGGFPGSQLESCKADGGGGGGGGAQQCPKALVRTRVIPCGPRRLKHEDAHGVAVRVREQRACWVWKCLPRCGGTSSAHDAASLLLSLPPLPTSGTPKRPTDTPPRRRGSASSWSARAARPFGPA